MIAGIFYPNKRNVKSENIDEISVEQDLYLKKTNFCMTRETMNNDSIV